VRRRSRIIAKLDPFARVVVPTASVTSGDVALAPLAEGFAADLTFLLERLGGVRVDALVFDGEGDGTTPTIPDEPPDSKTVDEILAEFQADAVLLSTLDWADDEASLDVRLVKAAGEQIWSASYPLLEGSVWQGRLAMGSEMVAAATETPIEASPLVRSGPQTVRGYRLLCEARCERLPPEDRLKHCQEAIAAEEELGEGWLLSADLLAAMDRHEEAGQLIMSLPERFPESPRVFLRRAHLLREKGDHDAARADIHKVISFEADGLALFESGQYLMTVGDEENAAESMQRAVERRCCHPFLYEQLGVFRANEGHEVAAVVLWERALAIDPSLHGILANLALGHHRLGNDERAEELFTQAAEGAPNHFATHYNLGLYYQDLRNWELAAGHFDKAIALRPNFPVLYLNRGTCLLRLGHNREAKEVLEEAAKLDTNGPIGRQAEDELNKIFIPVDPMQDAREYFQKGADRVKGNRPEQAIPYLKKAVKIAPRYWQAWFYLGTCYRLQEKWEAAVEAFRKVISIRDDQPDAHNELSVALGQLRRRDEALDHAKQAHELRPTDAGITSNLGLAYMEMEQLDEARHHFRKAHDLSPDDEIIARCLDELEQRMQRGKG